MLAILLYFIFQKNNIFKAKFPQTQNCKILKGIDSGIPLPIGDFYFSSQWRNFVFFKIFQKITTY